MGEGIKYVFEIDSKAPGLDALLSKLAASEKVLPKVSKESEHAAKSHKKHGEEAKGLTKVLDNLVHAGLGPLHEKLKAVAEFEFLRRGVDALLDIPAKLAEGVMELGSEMIKASAHAERMDKSMQLLFGKEKAEQHSDYINQIRKVLPFKKQTLEDAGLELARVGFKDTKDYAGLSRALQAAADMSSFSSNKEQGLFDALSALGKLKRSGDIEERALGALGVGKGDFLKELSHRTGEGIEALKKKLGEGKVTAEDSLEALYTVITRKTGKDLGGSAVEMGQGLDARLTRLHDLPDVYMDRLAASAAHTKFSGFVGKLERMLDPDTVAGGKIMGAIEHSALSLVKTLEKVDIGKTLLLGVQVLEKLPRLIDLSTRALEAFGFAAHGALGPLLPALGAAALATPAERGQLKDMGLKSIYGKSREELSQMGVIDRLGVGVKGAFKTVGGMLSAPFLDQPVTKGLLDDAKDGQSKLLDAGAAAGKAMVDGARGPKGIDAHSPSRKFAALGRQTVEGFALGVESGSGMLDNVMAGAFAVPAPSGGRAFGSPSIQVTVDLSGMNVNSGAGGEEISRAIADQVTRAVPDALLDAFERLRVEQGT